jgi:hypothetical protein
MRLAMARAFTSARPAQGNARARTVEARLSASAYLGSVGPELAERIGELGDRALERKAPGEATLRDRVFEVETEMVRCNLLSPAEVVATPSD